MATAVGEEDAAAWVNAVLAEAAADGGTVDSRIASVSLKLQTMSADLHADVDADMRALLAAAPRAVGEIEDLQAALQRVWSRCAYSGVIAAEGARRRGEAKKGAAQVLAMSMGWSVGLSVDWGCGSGWVC